jgi:hypothetical protein
MSIGFRFKSYLREPQFHQVALLEMRLAPYALNWRWERPKAVRLISRNRNT